MLEMHRIACLLPVSSTSRGGKKGVRTLWQHNRAGRICTWLSGISSTRTDSHDTHCSAQPGWWWWCCCTVATPAANASSDAGTAWLAARFLHPFLSTSYFLLCPFPFSFHPISIAWHTDPPSFPCTHFLLLLSLVSAKRLSTWLGLGVAPAHDGLVVAAAPPMLICRHSIRVRALPAWLMILQRRNNVQ